MNNIDLSIPEENLPIEIQATPVHHHIKSPTYSLFEQSIEKGIIQNITSYGMCWFFFDSELLRAMKNAGRGMSINMVWFRNYMKEDKLKVLTVSWGLKSMMLKKSCMSKQHAYIFNSVLYCLIVFNYLSN